MKSHAPTIESLKAKAPNELHAIFRKAAGDAVNAAAIPSEKATARGLMSAVRKCLSLQRGG